VLEDAVLAASDRDIGVAVATHDMHQARRIADRVAVLLDGRVIEMGPTERVFENPDDERTAKFVSGELVY
jgi:tungstate transport system ATP-binding protein